MILVSSGLWCALRTLRILPVLPWITGLQDEKVAIAVSGWSWSGETVAIDVHRSLCGDIVDGPLLAVGTFRAVLGGLPRLFDGWLLTESDRRGGRGGPSRISVSEVLQTRSRVTSSVLIVQTVVAEHVCRIPSCRVP